MLAKPMTRKWLTRSRLLIHAKPCSTKTLGFKVTNPLSSRPISRKKPRGKELTPIEKRHNRALSRVRVRVEHAIGGIKRARYVKDTLRNTRAACSDTFMETATGLHNLRVCHRKRALRR